jgi:stage V sporulation protein D (sporulation-specific penicillin-binding protein)
MRRKSTSSPRIKIIFIGFIFLFTLVFLRLFQLQVLQHKTYTTAAEGQYWKLQALNPRRGTIYSSDGYVLAGTSDHYLVYGEPQKIADVEGVSKALSGKLAELRAEQGDYATYYYDKFNTALGLDLMWVALERKITPTEKEVLEELALEGIGFEDEPARYYPEGSLAANILGYVAQNEDGEPTGYYGIEGMLNEDLKGKSGRVMQDVDALGTPVLTGRYRKVDPIEGRDIHLTLDRSVQYVVEKILKQSVEKYNASSGSIIVMDPFTGNVLAMANYPTYFPGNFLEKEEALEDFPHRKNIEKRNLNVSKTYEPGSVMKPVTVSAAIDLGLVSPNTTFVDNGPVQYSDYVIDNWNGQHHGVQTVTELLQKSNNIGAAWVGHQVGSQRLQDYLVRFGLGALTDIELEGEDTGSIRPYEDWTDIDLATISFGQGVSATPLQVLNTFNVIANGGYLLQPRLISEIHQDEEIIKIPTKNLGKVLEKDTAETMVGLLEEAASGGEAQYFVLKNYRIAGKTGTAQIPDETGSYHADKTNATFAGFLGGSKKFSMIVVLEEPQESVYASETAVPVWMEVTKELVKVFGLPPDK